MTNWLSRLRKGPADYSTVSWRESAAAAGVRFAVKQPSLAGRIELTRRLHEMTLRTEFLRGGNELEQLELTLAELMVEKVLLEWGLVAVEGLRLDGKAASVGQAIENGPEALVAEMAQAIKRQCGLDEEERKN